MAASSTPDTPPRKASRAVASVLHEGGSQKEREGERGGKGRDERIRLNGERGGKGRDERISLNGWCEE